MNCQQCDSEKIKILPYRKLKDKKVYEATRFIRMTMIRYKCLNCGNISVMKKEAIHAEIKKDDKKR